MDNYQKIEYCAYALPIITLIAAVYDIMLKPDTASSLITTIATITSVAVLSFEILKINNQQRDKDSRTSLKPNGSTRTKRKH